MARVAGRNTASSSRGVDLDAFEIVAPLDRVNECVLGFPVFPHDRQAEQNEVVRTSPHLFHARLVNVKNIHSTPSVTAPGRSEKKRV